MDDRGNYEDVGEKYQEGRSLEDLTSLILEEISRELPKVKATAVTKKFSGGRQIRILVLDAGDFDIEQRDVVDMLQKRIADIMKTFNYERGNVIQDYHRTSFYAGVRIEPAAFLLHASRTGKAANEVERKISLAEFKRRLKPGDVMEMLHGGRLGERIVSQVRSKDIVFNGPSYLNLGRADAFACDGDLVRFALGTENDPGRHLLYRWRPTADGSQAAA